MNILINPLRQLVIWPSNLYDGYIDCDKLNEDLTYDRCVFSCKGTLHQALQYGINNNFVPKSGWVQMKVDRIESWETLWPEAMKQLRNKAYYKKEKL